MSKGNLFPNITKGNETPIPLNYRMLKTYASEVGVQGVSSTHSFEPGGAGPQVLSGQQWRLVEKNAERFLETADYGTEVHEVDGDSGAWIGRKLDGKRGYRGEVDGD